MHSSKQALSKTLLVAFSCLVATVISFWDQFSYNFIAVVTCFVLFQLFFHEIYVKTLERALGTLLTALIAAGIIFLFRTNMMLTLILLALLAFVCLYFYAQKKYSYSMILGIITVGVMAGFVYLGSVNAAYHFAIYWIVNIVIGGVIVAVLSFIAHKMSWVEVSGVHLSSFNLKLYYDSASVLVALKVLIALMLIIFLTHYFRYDAVLLQAVIAGVVVSVQLDLKNTHHRVLFRNLGVFGGAVLAILYGHLVSFYPSTYFMGFLIVVSLALFTFLSEVMPKYLEYMFLQAGVMIPLILMDRAPGEFYNVALAMDRGIGSIVGGLIGLLVAYAFYWPIKKLEKSKSCLT